MPSYSDMLIFLRKREGISQQELADKLGMTRSAISMYETGKREPDFETLEALADFFNVDMNTLMGWSGDGDAQYLTLDRSAGGSFDFGFGFLGLKLCAVNCSLLAGNKGICFTDGTLLLPEDTLKYLNEDTNSYLRFRLQELRSKYKDNFTPKEASEAPPVE